MSFRHFTRAALAFAAMAAFSGGATAQITIVNSPHDLTDLSVGNTDNAEICVYCHTPHGARTDIAAPLWNKPTGTGVTYQRYDSTFSTTIDGEVLAVGSVSIACLTCHDGTQAMDSVINAPGSGTANNTIGGGGIADIGTAVTNLGTDLTNDHPIGILYGGFATGTAAQVDPDFKGSNAGLSTTGAGNSQRWWVDVANGVLADNTTPFTGVSGTREKTDMILYTRAFTGGSKPAVECASCHDPHAGNGTGAAGGPTGRTPDLGSNVNFMRISNTGSSVCLACHVK